MVAAPARPAALAFIFITAVLDVVALGLVIPVLPALIAELSGGMERAGVVNGVFVALWALMQFVASPLIGSLSDRFGRRPVLLISAAGLAADYVLMAIAPDLWWLALGRILTGVTSSSFTTVFAYMADITPPEKRARAYGLIGAAFSGGFVLGPLLGGLLGSLGPRMPFWFAAALSALTFLYGLVVLPESLPRDRRMKFSWARANPFGAFRLLSSHPELLGLAAVGFLMYFAHHLFSAVFVLYADYRYDFGPREVGFLLALVGVLDMIVQGALVGRVVKRIGDLRTMIAGLIGGSIGLAAMGLAPTGLAFTLAMLPNALWGLAMPTSQALMTRLVSEREQGQLQGASNSVASIAGVVSPVFFGTVYTLSIGAQPLLPHPGAAFLIAAIVLGLAALVGARAGRSAPSGAVG